MKLVFWFNSPIHSVFIRKNHTSSCSHIRSVTGELINSLSIHEKHYQIDLLCSDLKAEAAPSTLATFGYFTYLHIKFAFMILRSSYTTDRLVCPSRLSKINYSDDLFFLSPYFLHRMECEGLKQILVFFSHPWKFRIPYSVFSFWIFSCYSLRYSVIHVTKLFDDVWKDSSNASRPHPFAAEKKYSLMLTVDTICWNAKK